MESEIMEKTLKTLFGENNVRRCNMQFDRVFAIFDGNEELCHHTGFEVLLFEDDPPSYWWYVYYDSLGDYHFGR